MAVSIGAGKLNGVPVSPESAALIYAATHAFISVVVNNRDGAQRSTDVATHMMLLVDSAPGSQFDCLMKELRAIGGI